MNAKLRIGAGSSAAGMVRIEIVEDGSVKSVSVNPRLLRDGSEAIAQQVAEAIAAALAALMGANTDDSARREEVAKRLEEQRAEYVRFMRECNLTIETAMSRLMDRS